MTNTLSFFLGAVFSGLFAVPIFSERQLDSVNLRVEQPLSSSGSIGYTVSQAKAAEAILKIGDSLVGEIPETHDSSSYPILSGEEYPTGLNTLEIKDNTIDMKSLDACNRSEQSPVDVAILQDIEWVANEDTDSPFSRITFLNDADIILNTHSPHTSPYNLRGQYSLGDHTIDGLTPINLSIQLPEGVLDFHTVMKIQQNVRGDELKIAIARH